MGCRLWKLLILQLDVLDLMHTSVLLIYKTVLRQNTRPFLQGGELHTELQVSALA